MIGRPEAPVLVQEWFSLTCTHCGHFAQHVFPEVKAKLIDTGKIRYRFNDYPLDQLALLGAMIARSLPEERYLAFIDDLLTTQMQWAFARHTDPYAELRTHAARTGGLAPTTFDSINADNALRQAIVARQDQDQARLHIAGTPFFMINETVLSNNAIVSYETFANAIAKVHHP